MLLCTSCFNDHKKIHRKMHRTSSSMINNFYLLFELPNGKLIHLVLYPQGKNLSKSKMKRYSLAGRVTPLPITV